MDVRKQASVDMLSRSDMGVAQRRIITEGYLQLDKNGQAAQSMGMRSALLCLAGGHLRAEIRGDGRGSAINDRPRPPAADICFPDCNKTTVFS